MVMGFWGPGALEADRAGRAASAGQVRTGRHSAQGDDCQQGFLILDVHMNQWGALQCVSQQAFRYSSAVLSNKDYSINHEHVRCFLQINEGTCAFQNRVLLWVYPRLQLSKYPDFYPQLIVRKRSSEIGGNAEAQFKAGIAYLRAQML